VSLEEAQTFVRSSRQSNEPALKIRGSGKGYYPVGYREGYATAIGIFSSNPLEYFTGQACETYLKRWARIMKLLVRMVVVLVVVEVIIL